MAGGGENAEEVQRGDGEEGSLAAAGRRTYLIHDSLPPCGNTDRKEGSHDVLDAKQKAQGALPLPTRIKTQNVDNDCDLTAASSPWAPARRRAVPPPVAKETRERRPASNPIATAVIRFAAKRKPTSDLNYIHMGRSTATALRN